MIHIYFTGQFDTSWEETCLSNEGSEAGGIRLCKFTQQPLE